MTFQQICKDVHTVKTNGQQVFIESRNRPPPRKTTNTGEMKGRLTDLLFFHSSEVTWKQTSNTELFLVQRNQNVQFSFLNVLFFHQGTAGIQAVNSDPIRGLIEDLMQPPKALVPAPLMQKEPSTGYSYQQINCLDSIIRFVSKTKHFCPLLCKQLTL